MSLTIKSNWVWSIWEPKYFQDKRRILAVKMRFAITVFVRIGFWLCYNTLRSNLLSRRKIKVSFEEFKKILSKTTVEHEELSPEICNYLKTVGFGSTVLYIDEIINGHRVVDAVCINNFYKNFNTMINKELFESYKIRYLYWFMYTFTFIL